MPIKYNFSEGLLAITIQVEKAKKPILIAIAGGSCSGKSFLASELEKQLKNNRQKTCLISQDCFYRGADTPGYPIDKHGKKIHDLPDCIDKKLYINSIQKLLSGKNIHVPEYDFTICQRVKESGKLIMSAPVIITEGLFAITLLKDHFSNIIKIFIHADEKKRLDRRVCRDIDRCKINDKKIREIFETKVLPYHKKYVTPQKKLADIIIKNN